MNCRPLPYQGSALPLSYNSAVGQQEVDIKIGGHHNQGMTETQDKTPPKTKGFGDTPKGGVKLKDLAAKRAQNLRDNLAKRKQQARARETDKS